MLQRTIPLLCLFAGLVANAQLITCPAMGFTPERQAGKNNYVIDAFTETLAFPYALNRCTSTSLFATGEWYKYTCNKVNGAWTVTKTQYSDLNCTQSENTIGHWIEGGSQEGTTGFFECDGQDSYVKLTMSISSNCSNSQIVFAGLGGCAANGALQNDLYCDGQGALLQLYLDLFESFDNVTFSSSSYYPDNLVTKCDPNLYCDKWYFSPSVCNFVANIFGFTIYGNMDTCSVASLSETNLIETSGRSTDNPNKSSASSIFVLSNFLFVLIVSLFSLV